ncbi:transketolase family protein [Mongoliimonas terrestris]|uniref:transketolase family protein n=1 Tax=Mongoliimonas terrestris TaxID=1709001 RepID=UPI000949AF92|nr:transketolase [Mongoliimonas terrestris]
MPVLFPPVTPAPLAAAAHAIRFLSVDAFLAAGEGHPGAPLGMAEIATALFADHLNYDPTDPLWPDRDRLVVSNGHGSMLLYAPLHLAGYAKISLDQVKRFRELGSHCAGHPEYEPDAGIETTTGPLGQGIGNALGMAIAEAHLRARFGADLIDHYTYAFVGDGCLQEGVGQEVIALAGHLGLGRLIFLWDDNEMTDDGVLSIGASEDVPARFRAAGWHVSAVDGHDIAAVSAAIAAAKQDPRPSMIACRTTIARGIPRVEGQRAGHGGKVFPDDRAAMAERFGWTAGSFDIPADVRATWRGFADRAAPRVAGWRQRFASAPTAMRDALGGAMAGNLLDGWRKPLHAYKVAAAESGEGQPGIASSGDVAALLYDRVPELMTGCADLEASTNHKRQLAAFTADHPAGRYLHCGVREHAMAALANGLAAHGGVIPAAVTYLAFSDYERPAMRMASLMGLPVKFVFSHDSIGIGRNGPTHQPVETLASLRAMPNMLVFRPADAVETAECWEIAMEHRTGPVTFALSRQPLPLVRRDGGAENRSARGAYVLSLETGGYRRVTLMATGSEVAIALEARRILQGEGIPTAVVSMPCWELFEAEDPAYREAVLEPGTVRIGIEAAVRFGWDRWLGAEGAFVGMSGFGASGPPEALFRHFGITVDAVVAAAKRQL